MNISNAAPDATAAAGAGSVGPTDHGPSRPWLTCAVPMLVYLVAETLLAGGESGKPLVPGLPAVSYPIAYLVKLAATLVAVAVVWPHLKPWVGRPRWWPPLLGVALVVPWVVLAWLQREAGWGGTGRSSFDPFAHFAADPRQAWAFLAARWLGLVVAVPIVEELFLRGFLMRFVIDEKFWKVPFGLLTPAAAGACALYAAISHPAEAVAAVGWFAIVSGIAAATRQPIDCILAHAGTNLALGAFVLATGNWWLM